MSNTNKRKMAGGRSGDRPVRAACTGDRPVRVRRLRGRSGDSCLHGSAARAVRSVRARWAGRAARSGKVAAYCICFTCLLCCALGACSAETESRLRLVSWNLQTFFDAERTGNEYEDFVMNRHWGESAYSERLKRLCDSLAELDADVLVLQELENEAVLQDISNFLCARWLFNRQYRWAAFVREEGAALGCAVLSRCPVEKLSCHGLDARSSPQGKKPGLRPLMQLRIVKNGRSFFLLVNHWKSMSGGREASESWRDAQEALLGRSLKKLRGLPVIACGDFNRDIGDFKRSPGGARDGAAADAGFLSEGGTVPREYSADAGTVVLSTGEGDCVAVASPWFLPDGTLAGPGSYYYKEAWSRIDNFFYAGKILLEDFAVETGGPWCYGDTKIPKKYQVWSGRGYSDHLPLSCTLVF